MIVEKLTALKNAKYAPSAASRVLSTSEAVARLVLVDYDDEKGG